MADRHIVALGGGGIADADGPLVYAVAAGGDGGAVETVVPCRLLGDS